MEITERSISDASKRIQPYVRRTPLLEIRPDLVFKLDLLQPTGSFKVRGAFSLLTARPDVGRVVAASGGNFGSAVAYAGFRLGRQVDVFVPSTSPRTKVDRIRSYGANVHVIDGYYEESLVASQRFLHDIDDAVEAHAFDDPHVVAGQGTCGLEIVEQFPDVDTMLVAVGGGGLIGGIASWVRDRVRVVAVETHGTAALNAALEAGSPVAVEVGGLAADSLGATRVGALGFEAARLWVDRSVLVSDDDVKDAQRWLWDECRLVVEPGAAVALAALRSGAYQAHDGERVCVVVCGANADAGSVSSMMAPEVESGSRTTKVPQLSEYE